MAQTAETQDRPNNVQAALNYLVYTGLCRRETRYVTRLGEAPIKRSATYEKYEVSIQNSRSIGKNTSLDRVGFLFTHHISNVVDLYNRAEVSKHYCREVESLVIGGDRS